MKGASSGQMVARYPEGLAVKSRSRTFVIEQLMREVPMTPEDPPPS